MEDYSHVVAAVIAYIEARPERHEYEELARSVGLSLSPIRALFRRHTGQTLGRYALERRMARAAYGLVHTETDILQLALQCGYSSPDTFTRAFKRVMGQTPSDYRRERRAVGRERLYKGIYGVSDRMKGRESMNQPLNGGMILYGVTKVGYGAYGSCTPYPICLKSIANYLGEDVEIHDIMVGCGAAFRLTWNVTGWDGANVDICYTYDDFDKVYRLGVESLGRAYKTLGRGPDTPKEAFVRFIREQIDQGRPVIATGIIGPPEACIVTGYQDEGETLLGWNFFQDSVMYGGLPARTDESGYFISHDWWENTDTQALIGVGEKTGPRRGITDILSGAAEVMTGRHKDQFAKGLWTYDALSGAAEVMTGRRKDQFAKGLWAYDAWKAALSNDRDFPDHLPLLSERMMCQGDAMDCLADGRSCAARFFRALAAKTPEQPLYRRIAGDFERVTGQVEQMAALLGGWGRGEAQMRALARPETRRALCRLIDGCRQADEAALEGIKLLMEQMETAAYPAEREEKDGK